MTFSIITCGALTQNCFGPRGGAPFSFLSQMHFVEASQDIEHIFVQEVDNSQQRKLKGGAPDASEGISDLPYQRKGPLNEQLLKTKLKSLKQS